MQPILDVFSPRRRGTIRRHLLVASLLAGALLVPVNEAVQAEIIPTGETFELSISENNLKASKRWATPAVQFPKVMNDRVDCDDANRPDLNPGDVEEDTTRCYDHTLKVSYPSSLRPVRLRVGLNTRNAITGTQLIAADGWDVQLFGPPDEMGRRTRRGALRVGGPTPSQDVTEVVADLRDRDGNDVLCDPDPDDPLGPDVCHDGVGDWTVRVAAFEVNKLQPPDSETPFIFPQGQCTGDPNQPFCEPTFAELRAILEAEPDSPVEEKPLLPDLAVVPPYQLQFGCQAAGGAALPDSPPPPGDRPAAVCLRAAFGHGNVGDGPLELEITPNAEKSLAQGKLVADATQRVFLRDDTPWDYTNNKFQEFPAGTASFHELHGHWHYDNIWTARLFRVRDDLTFDPNNPVVSAKRGNCAHDGMLLRWKQTFFSEARGTNDSGDDELSGDCQGLATDRPTGIRIGLSRGWADAYAATLPDQYFDFTKEAADLALFGEATYLAQVQIDAPVQIDDEDGLIHEVKEDNNFGYTMFKISNFDPVSAANPALGRGTIKITILERGRGKSHLDSKKVPLFGIAE